MSTRTPIHSRIEANLSRLLGNWLLDLPEPRGQVLAGEARFRLRREADTVVGIDVSYISPERAAATSENAKFVDGPPVLAVEILSPSDTHERITDKVREYLEAGVPLVWVVDPSFTTVGVHKPDSEPESFNIKKKLTGEPLLPGLKIAVAEIFAR